MKSIGEDECPSTPLGCGLLVNQANALTELHLPRLEFVASQIKVTGNEVLEEINLPSLAEHVVMNGEFEITANPALKLVDLPALLHARIIFVNDGPELTNLHIPVLNALFLDVPGQGSSTLALTGAAKLTSVSAPRLVSLYGLNLSSMSGLVSLNFPALVQIENQLSIFNNPKLGQSAADLLEPQVGFIGPSKKIEGLPQGCVYEAGPPITATCPP